MYKISVCDDSHVDTNRYIDMIQQASETHGFAIEIACFKNGESLLFHLTESPNRFDIIYLDVMMEELNGIETAKQLRAMGCEAQIVFLTSSEDYVFEAYDVLPIHYLLKTKVAYPQFEEVFLRSIRQVEKKTVESLVFNTGTSVEIIPVGDIAYFEVFKRIVTVHRHQMDPISFYSSLKELEKKLINRSFVRTHRSYIVNLSHIARFKKNTLILKSGVAIPVGATYLNGVKQIFASYMSDQL